MNTISSNNSLILFQNNRNRSNIFKPSLFLADNYLHLFQRLADVVQKSQQLSIVDLWKKECEAECCAVRKAISDNCNADGTEGEIDRLAICQDIERVVNKFRGNVGEIFVEMMMTNGLCSDICENGSYGPVNPNQERYIDGECISPRDGQPSGIQIKNYNDSLVCQEVFMKAAAESALWIQHDRRIPREELAEYLDTPHQYLISFTDSKQFNEDNFSGVVVFLGPDWIDSKGIQGDVKKGLPGNYRIFKKVASEIEAFIECESMKNKSDNATIAKVVDLVDVEIEEKPVVKKQNKKNVKPVVCSLFKKL